jgi:hypothetical protein
MHKPFAVSVSKDNGACATLNRLAQPLFQFELIFSRLF